MTVANVDFGLAFMAGLLGSGHCVGMCGALTCGFFIRMGKTGKGIVPLACYHGARLAVYGAVGLLASLVGLALISTGLIGKAQAVLQILAGLLVIALGLDVLGLIRMPALGLPITVARRIFLRAAEASPIQGPLLGGVVNGLMPCALTLAMAVKASSVPDPLLGGALMLAFGAGTLPAMLFVSVIFGRLGSAVRGWLLKAAAMVVIVMGVATLMQGVRFFEVMLPLPNW
jgi:uncharacterized protein